MRQYPKAKKSLGQNFLVDDNIRRKIIADCNICSSDTVLEIGPGLGALTRGLVKVAKKVSAVEKDKSLYEYLKEEFKDHSNLYLIHEDILKYFLGETKTKVIGNIPYNIASPLLEHLIRQKHNISRIFMTIQKELAQRMIAQAGSKDYSAFSLFIQYHTEPKILFPIKRTCFRPQPKVDSCFIELGIPRQPVLQVKNEKLLFQIIHICFNQRRKMITNTLKEFLGKSSLDELYAVAAIDPTVRPEQLSLQDFSFITDFIWKKRKTGVV
ncbi:16S rRNA (adenine(1518)-N(6)/adenine(1519)-N(6))-dimethyltransferase RsmA [Candidatus Omnitrophota bacterium]